MGEREPAVSEGHPRIRKGGTPIGDWRPRALRTVVLRTLSHPLDSHLPVPRTLQLGGHTAPLWNLP